MHYFAEIDKAILMINEDEVTSDNEYLNELDEEIPNILGDQMTRKEKSPFGKHFQLIFNKCKVLVDNLENKYHNHSFHPIQCIIAQSPRISTNIIFQYIRYGWFNSWSSII